MKKQPIAEFRANAKSLRASFLSILKDFEKTEHEIYDFILETSYGKIKVHLDIDDDPNFRSIWLYTNFQDYKTMTDEQKNKFSNIHGNTHWKWNHCLFQTTKREEFSEDDLDVAKYRLIFLLNKLK